MAHVRTLKSVAPFNELFPIKPEVLEAVKKSIMINGFDPAHPLIIWYGKDIIVDGHTRYQAALELDYGNVYTFHKRFANEDEALQYAIEQQTLRRNLSDAEIIRCIEALDQRRKRGGDHKSEKYQSKSKTSGEVIDRPKASAQETAKTVGVSRSKVERARTVLDKADEETKIAVKEGTMSINKAYETTMTKSRAAAQEQAQAQTQSQTQAQALATEPELTPEEQADLHKQELRQALEELLAWRQKYRHLYEFGNYFAAIDELLQVRLVK